MCEHFEWNQLRSFFWGYFYCLEIFDENSEKHKTDLRAFAQEGTRNTCFWPWKQSFLFFQKIWKTENRKKIFSIFWKTGKNKNKCLEKHSLKTLIFNLSTS